MSQNWESFSVVDLKPPATPATPTSAGKGKRRSNYKDPTSDDDSDARSTVSKRKTNRGRKKGVTDDEETDGYLSSVSKTSRKSTTSRRGGSKKKRGVTTDEDTDGYMSSVSRKSVNTTTSTAKNAKKKRRYNSDSDNEDVKSDVSDGMDFGPTAYGVTIKEEKIDLDEDQREELTYYEDDFPAEAENEDDFPSEAENEDDFQGPAEAKNIRNKSKTPEKSRPGSFNYKYVWNKSLSKMTIPVEVKYVWNKSLNKMTIPVEVRKGVRSSPRISEKPLEDDDDEEEAEFNLLKLDARAEFSSDDEDDEGDDSDDMKPCMKPRYLFIRRPNGGVFANPIPLSRKPSGDVEDERTDLVWSREKTRLVKRTLLTMGVSPRWNDAELIQDDEKKLEQKEMAKKPTVTEPAGEEAFTCRICQAVFDKYVRLCGHLRTVHNEKPEKSNLCFVCAKVFATRATLTLHIKQMHGGGQTDYVREKEVCEICSARVVNLAEHKLCHEPPRFTCEYCVKPFRRTQELRNHVKAVHLTETPEERPRCEVCGKTFGLKEYLRRHMRTHRVERKYKCVCGDGFNFNVSLKVHMAKCAFYLKSLEKEGEESSDDISRESSISRSASGPRQDNHRPVATLGDRDNDDDDDNSDVDEYTAFNPNIVVKKEDGVSPVEVGGATFGNTGSIVVKSEPLGDTPASDGRQSRSRTTRRPAASDSDADSGTFGSHFLSNPQNKPASARTQNLKTVLESNLGTLVNKSSAKSQNYLAVIMKNYENRAMEPVPAEMGESVSDLEDKPLAKRKARSRKSVGPPSVKKENREKSCERKPSRRKSTVEDSDTDYIPEVEEEPPVERKKKEKREKKKKKKKEKIKREKATTGDEMSDFAFSSYESDSSESSMSERELFGPIIYKCRHCDVTFRTYELLLRHLTGKHGGFESAALCFICGFYHKHKKMIYRHIKEHIEPKKQEKKVCDICSAEVIHLGTHQKVAHSGVTYNCKFCSMKFTRVGQMNIHIKTVHLKHMLEKKFVCQYCNKEFPFQGYLNKHMKTHNHHGNGPGGGGHVTYTCKQCNLTFTNKHLFRNHKLVCGTGGQQQNQGGNTSAPNPLVPHPSTSSMSEQDVLQQQLQHSAQVQAQAAQQAAQAAAELSIHQIQSANFPLKLERASMYYF
ncbi:gastrula zinc finger protein xFG20-1 [Diaphorina citri]|uniref:Gastrula zinc finger protein xFG20-1 n=2 Tax=Diaphorina citri TaxID=121845 RepID=A0A3Q0JPG6_DIACI|nr:gastrula zinc finger protein xFG20-1 [Diaphorina citri]